MVLKAGLLGLGVMGRNHARVLSNLEGVELVGVYDLAADLPQTVEGKPVTSNLNEFLNYKPDYCVVAVPTIYHLELGLKLAENGIHALIEKPIASDSQSAAELVSAFENAGLVGGVGHIERFNPSLQSMRARIEAGQLGEIYQVATHRQGPFPGRIADVGVVKDLATHDIDLTAWVTQQEYVSVNSRSFFKSGRDHEDMVLAIGSLSSGAITNHIVNWLSPIKERRTVVTGELGCLIADTLTADLTFYANGTTPEAWEGISIFRGVSEGDMTRYALEKKEPLRTEHEVFRDALLSGDSSHIVSLKEGLKILETAEKIVADARLHSLKGKST